MWKRRKLDRQVPREEGRNYILPGTSKEGFCPGHGEEERRGENGENMIDGRVGACQSLRSKLSA